MAPAAPDKEVLFRPLKLGNMELKHRIVMSPMTRLRNEPGSEKPRALNIQYYEQRATDGGLCVVESTYPSRMARGYVRMPGITNDEQVEAWRRLVDAVHSKGAKIAMQLMHAGRASHTTMLPNNSSPIAPSAVQMKEEIHIEDGSKAMASMPREMTKEDIKTTIGEFVGGAKRSIDAGFDAVELHGGNGYLLQEFMAKETNQRTDEYGGSVENRARFVLELVDAVSDAIGSEHVGLKLQPGVTFEDLIEPEDDVLEQMKYFGAELSKRKLAYVTFSSLNGPLYSHFAKLDKPNLSFDALERFRDYYFLKNLIVNGELNPESAAKLVANGRADAVCFGMLFLATPNLVEAIRHGVEPVMAQDTSSWYGGDPKDDAKGYVDFPPVQVKSST